MDGPESLPLLHDEAHRVLEWQFAALREMGTRAMQLMTLTGALAGAFVAAVPFIAEAAAPGGGARSGTLLILPGILLLVTSMGLSASAYLRRSLSLGIHPDDLVEAAARGVPAEDFLRAAVASRAASIAQNARAIESGARWFRASLWVFVCGLALAAVGGAGFILSAIVSGV